MPRYFTDAEVKGLDPAFVAQLDRARSLAGVPFHLTETVAEGGSHVANTAHQRGLAADIGCADSISRYWMLKALFEVGFRRIGVYDRHLHVDADPSLPQEVAWVGISH